MKKLLLLAFLGIGLFVFSQGSNTNQLVERTYQDLGKILDFKSSIVSTKNISTGDITKTLIIETKSFASNDVKNFELDKAQAIEFHKNIESLLNHLKSNQSAELEVSISNSFGHEVGALFILDKAAPASQTKKEKYYIETKEKYYEGKIVNNDAHGTFIWKEVTSSKEPSGKWNPFIRLNNNSAKTSFSLSVDELKELAVFIKKQSENL